nr:uncharacterized protein LOC109164617 [Ipomoea batatas]
MTSALGTSEQKRGHGTVRGIGSYSSIRQVFGKLEQKQHTPGGVTPTAEVEKMLEKCRQATLLDVQPKIGMLTQQLNILMKNMLAASQCPQGVLAGTSQSVYAPCDIPPTRSNCHSVDAYPVTTIKGTAYPTTAEIIVVHNQPVLPNHVKVMVDELVMGADQDCLLPCQCCSMRLLMMLLVKNVFMLLGKNCKRLVKTLASFPGDKEYIDMDLDPTVFNHGNVNGVFVMLEDIKDLLTMNWLCLDYTSVYDGGEVVIAWAVVERRAGQGVFGEPLGSFPDFINPSGELDDNERLVESPEVLGVGVELQGGLEVSYGGLCAFQMGCNVR